MDDSATDRRIMRRLLESVGWIKVTELSSPRDVVPVLSKGAYELIITDIMMPDMDGFELVREIRNRGFDLPVIAVSSRSESADRKKIALSGINAFIAKPISLQLMLEKIDELVAQNQGTDQ